MRWDADAGPACSTLGGTTGLMGWYLINIYNDMETHHGNIARGMKFLPVTTVFIGQYMCIIIPPSL